MHNIRDENVLIKFQFCLKLVFLRIHVLCICTPASYSRKRVLGAVALWLEIKLLGEINFVSSLALLRLMLIKF